MNNLFTGILLVALATSLSACQEPAPEPAEQPPTPIVNHADATESAGQDQAEATWTSCPETRPEMCAQIYQPVCGLVDTGVRCVTTPCPSSIEKTFGNACTACAEPLVSQYRAGECKTPAEDPQ